MEELKENALDIMENLIYMVKSDIIIIENGNKITALNYAKNMLKELEEAFQTLEDL